MHTARKYIPRIPFPLARFLLWAAYGYVQGQQMTGVWVRRISEMSDTVVFDFNLRSLATNVVTGRSPQTTT